MASFMASLRVREPDSTGMTSHPSRFIRYTLSRCLSTSRLPMYTAAFISRAAQAMAVATPCWPAPVSAIMRDFFICRASRGLAQGVVYLVGAAVAEVLAL